LALGVRPALDIKNIKDIRNYKVSIERAKNVLSFHPHHDVRSIVGNLIANMSKCSDWDNPRYYNIHMFRQLETSAAKTTAAAMLAGDGQ
jgi:hypothetical protein